MQKLVWQNANGVELDLTSGNYGITEWEGFSNASLNIQSQQVPFQDGGVFLDALIEQRELSVTLAMQDNNNLELRYQQRRELISALNPKLGEGYLIYTNDYTSKRIKCVAQIPLFETHNSDTVGTPKASLSWTACEPYWEDLEDTVIEVKAGQNHIIKNMGDYKTGLNIYMKMFGKGVENPIIKNITTNQKLELRGTFKNDVIINTNTGKKNVSLLNQNYNAYNYKKTLLIVYKQETQSLLALVSGMVLESLDNGKTWEKIYASRMNVRQCTKIGNDYYLGCSWLGASGTRILKTRDFETFEQMSTIGNYFAYNEQDNVFAVVSFPSNNKVYVGSDLNNLSEITLINTSVNFNSIIYSKEKSLYCIVGGTWSNSEPLLFTSSDGTTWQRITPLVFPQNNCELKKVVYGNGVFVITSGSYLYMSRDGVNWEDLDWTNRVPVYTNIIDIILVDKTWVIFTFVSGLDNKIRIYISKDNFSTLEMFLEIDEIVESGNGKINYIKEVGEIFISSDYFSGSFSLSSPDTYKLLQKYKTLDSYYPNPSVIRNRCIYAKNEYIFISGTKYCKSTDGVNWSEYSFSNNVRGKSICFVESLNLFVMCGTSGKIYTSSDFVNWQEKTTPTSNDLHFIVYDKDRGMFYSGGAEGTLITSSDLETWSSVNTGLSVLIQDIAIRSDKVIAVGGRYMIKSVDGLSWTTEEITNIESSNNVNSITCDNEKFCMVFWTQARIMYSYDGDNWTSVSLTAGEYESPQFYQVLYDENTKLFYAMANLFTSGFVSLFTSADCVNWVKAEVFSWGGGSPNIIFVHENKYLIFFASGMQYANVRYEYENIINDLTKDSDIGFVLKEGDNSINASTDGIITYRQKYIGV